MIGKINGGQGRGRQREMNLNGLNFLYRAIPSIEPIQNNKLRTKICVEPYMPMPFDNDNNDVDIIHIFKKSQS